MATKSQTPKSEIAILFVGPISEFSWIEDPRFVLLSVYPFQEIATVQGKRAHRCADPDAILRWSPECSLWITVYNRLGMAMPRIAPYYKADGVIELLISSF